MRNSKFYKDIGFMCGLEIHQRLATKEKLFCACKANLETDESIGEIRRRQRAVAGELGVIDASTQFESSKNRQFVYNTFEKETCLVDVDEEPPHDLNKEALGIALQIAAAFNAKVPDELEPMRKVVVDGSDPSAFQRTILVGYDGYVKVGSKKINVPSIFLEEESSGIEHSDRELVIYNVDRLGIPLVEIDTAPEISTPEEAKEAAKQIGLLLRLTGKVQRGIGTIRQDVNVSIKNGARTEIKGFQDLDSMPQVIDNEVERQLALLKVRDMVAKRKAAVGQAIDISHVFSSTKCGIIRKSLDSNGTVIGFALKGFKGALGYELNPGRRLGSEISEYAKLAGVGGIIHSDENLAQYGISESEIREIEKALKTGANDAFVLVTGPSDVCATAVAYARQRAELAIKQVPKETRGIDSKTLITKFLRPLPGGSRMYPETDIRPIPVNAKEYGILIKKAVNPEIVLKELEKEIENKDLAMQMLWSPLLSTYNEILNKTGVMGSVVAPILLEKYTELRRQGIDTEAITTDAIVAIFEEYKSKTITKAAIEELLKHTPKTKKDVLDAIRSLNLQRITGRRLEELVAKFSDKPKNDTLREIMAKYRLVVDGAELNALLKTMKQ
ncbi:MAG: Glu-tRNA(Gln) amidotransferase subunit GatE [Candidatus Micrarchaeaceae archaeon]